MHSRTFMREQRIVCGERYMEVDIYQVTEQRARPKREKGKATSSEKQQRLNDKNARRYLVQLANANFTARDLHLTCTYDNAHLPQSEEQAERDLGNYLRRVNYALRRQGKAPARYIAVTEGRAQKDGSAPARWHHHIIIGADLTRDELEALWSRDGEPLGICNADRLNMSRSLNDLCSYMLKNPNRKRRWRQSRGLRMPERKRPNDTKWNRGKVDAVARSGQLHDADYWEKQFAGWQLLEVEATEPNDYTTWHFTVKMRR